MTAVWWALFAVLVVGVVACAVYRTPAPVWRRRLGLRRRPSRVIYRAPSAAKTTCRRCDP